MDISTRSLDSSTCSLETSTYSLDTSTYFNSDYQLLYCSTNIYSFPFDLYGDLSFRYQPIGSVFHL